MNKIIKLKVKVSKKGNKKVQGKISHTRKKLKLGKI